MGQSTPVEITKAKAEEIAESARLIQQHVPQPSQRPSPQRSHVHREQVV
jgi:hypothetical protein